ncbi:DUF927 domain-containing protein [Rhodopila sp.]|uniref:DUF927 domain-containing protein n=1 Tax=Rhodopila sp. TaxID=2480087 RepID=UPI003D119C2D
MFDLQKVANIDDELSFEAYEVFQFLTVDQDIRHIRIERGRSRNVNYVYRELLRANAALPSNDAEARRFVQEAIAAETPKRLHYATHLGWRPNLNGFVLCDECIGTPTAVAAVLPPKWVEEFSDNHISTLGTLKSWQGSVAKPAAKSSRLILLAAAAFAAPLVRFAKGVNLGFNLFGLNYQETCIAAAFVGSIVGCAPNELISDWWVAPGSLLKRTRLFGDQLFLAGSLVAYPERMATPRQHERLLALQTGEDRLAKERPTAGRWRGIFVSLLTSASTVSGAADRENDRFVGVPCVDIPAASKFSPLLDLPSLSATAADLRPTVRVIQRMAEAANRNRGVPIRRYLRYLVKSRSHLPSKISKLSRQFARLGKRAGPGSAPRSLLDRFGLLYAGGCLAIEAGVLPWGRRQVLTALWACLSAARGQRRADRLSPKKIRRTLRDRLRTPSVVARLPGVRFGPDDHAGFFGMVDGRRQHTIHAKAFRSWFGGSKQCAAALAWLHQRGLLVLGDKPATPWLASGEWAERTPRWPDGRVQKSFMFLEPLPQRGAPRTVR